MYGITQFGVETMRKTFEVLSSFLFGVYPICNRFFSPSQNLSFFATDRTTATNHPHNTLTKRHYPQPTIQRPPLIIGTPPTFNRLSKMSIGATMNTGITVRSPSAKNTHSGNNNFDDVELGTTTNASSPSQGNKRRSLKAKESDMELKPLVIDNGDGSNKMPTTPRGTPRGGNSVSAEGERSSTVKSLIASALYSGCSVGMVLVNKSLASRYVVVVQCACCVLLQ